MPGGNQSLCVCIVLCRFVFLSRVFKKRRSVTGKVQRGSRVHLFPGFLCSICCGCYMSRNDMCSVLAASSMPVIGLRKHDPRRVCDVPPVGKRGSDTKVTERTAGEPYPTSRFSSPLPCRESFIVPSAPPPASRVLEAVAEETLHDSKHNRVCTHATHAPQTMTPMLHALLCQPAAD